jgi:hypothetical protein
MTELEKIEAQRYETNAKVFGWTVALAAGIIILDLIISFFS